MKIIPPGSDKPEFVYVIWWKRSVAQNVISTAKTSFGYSGNPGLEWVYEQECEIVDGSLDNFEFLPPKPADADCNLVWRPLLSSGILYDLVDFHRDALEAFERLRQEAGHAS